MPYLLLLFLLFLAIPARADQASDVAAACDPTTPIPVQVTPRFDPPGYDYSQPVSKISAMAADENHSIHEHLTLGLTRYEPLLSIKAPVMGVQLPDGTNCAHVQKVDVSIGYQNVVVYIAKEIPQNSCGFNEVMKHEQKHIAVNAAVLQKYAPLIQAALEDYLKTGGTLKEENLDFGISQIKTKLNDIIRDTMTQMVAENEQLQRNVDTPAEYARVSASCNGQLASVIGQIMQR